jgi:hypothetical protein
MGCELLHWQHSYQASRFGPTITVPASTVTRVTTSALEANHSHRESLDEEFVMATKIGLLHMVGERTVATAASLFLAGLGCGTEAPWDGEGYSDSAQEAGDSAISTSPLQNDDSPRLPSPRGNLTAERRSELGSIALERFESQSAQSRANGESNATGQPTNASNDGVETGDERREAFPSSPGGRSGADDSAGAGLEPPGHGKLTAEQAESLSEFLDSVVQTGNGYMIGDMIFASEDSLIDTFFDTYRERIDKGIGVPSKSWSGSAPILSVCWAAASSGSIAGGVGATNAEKARVAELVDATWSAYSMISFDWGTGGNWRTCSGAADTSNIKIYQHSNVTRACAYVGTDHTSGAGTDCDGDLTVEHGWATMGLPTVGATSWLEYNMVHEFGHVLSFRHEQIRLDYVPGTCAAADGNGDANTQTASDSSFGLIDNESIMHYCADSIPDISIVDAKHAQLYYDNRTTNVRWRVTSWYPSQVTTTTKGQFTLPDDDVVNASLSPFLFLNGLTVTPSNSYVTSATSNNSRLTCFVKQPLAPLVRGNSRTVLPTAAWNVSQVEGDCIDVGALAMLF